MSTIIHGTRRLTRRLALAAVTSSLVLGAVAAAAEAKDGIGGATGGTGTCNPVKSLSYQGDANPAESGIPTIDVAYSVKPCVKGQRVRVATELHLSASPSSVAHLADPAPASGTFTVTGVLPNTSYQAQVTVYDAATGAVVGSRWIWAAANDQGV